ncbi:uncharacterized protein BDFB_001003 [Asbolus verrucosus]|uniref:Uncharacterized protein n=1 Tax=Asbolus verrucosus TaxID=1661398 RepID=A0A482W8G4_ASBVE|nr:uncharacterized protein BDFB_001003 [Asbolus verrucosus]
MSTIERKEYQETKIMRTVSPVRNIRSSNQNLAEFDHNLDYLLEDLQNSVSRPSSSLGTHRETSRAIESTRSNSLNRFTNVKPSNPVTEYSSDDTYNYTSPDGSKRVTGYKKETYSYKTSGDTAPPEKVTMQNNINQLDSLLDDLQQVKNSPFPERESYNNTGVGPDFQTIQRELHYGDTPRSSSRSRTLERTEREASLTRDVQYTNEGTYGDIRQIRGRSPSPSSKTSTLSKQTKVKNVHAYPVEVVETTSPDINPEILAHLDPSLHPPGNTKVTTTIKTYTYEIPGAGNYPTNLDTSVDTEKYVYSPNQSLTTPSKSFVYKKIENKSSENTINYPPPYQKPAPPGGSTTVKETITTRNYQPGYSPETVPPNNQTYVYNETTTTRNINENVPKGSLPRDNHPRQQTYVIEEHHNTVTNRNVNRPYPDDRDYPPRGNQPPRQDTYIIKEIHDTNTTNTINHPYPDSRDYPPPSRDYPPSTQHYIKEIHDTNTTSNVHHTYPNGYPPNEPNKTVIYRHETHTTNNYGPESKPKPTDAENFDPKYPPYDNRRPNEPVNIHYRYKSESTTTNNFKAGYPPSDETQALLPKPFPTDNQPDGPPRRLDELMADIGNEPPTSPYNIGYNMHEQEKEQKKKIETLKRQQEEVEDTQKKEPVHRSKNVSGPPVYYPPGHEMFAKKEEGGAWRAEGGYERASGKYKYEAESKSKSKSSSGAAIVPVCLPLCCGLPCAII